MATETVSDADTTQKLEGILHDVEHALRHINIARIICRMAAQNSDAGNKLLALEEAAQASWEMIDRAYGELDFVLDGFRELVQQSGATHRRTEVANG